MMDVLKLRLAVWLISIGVAASPAASASEAASPAKAEAQKSTESAALKNDKKVESVPVQAGTNTPNPGADRLTATVWRVLVKVVNPDEARAAVDVAARALGGFPMFFNGRAITVKIPPAALTALTEKVCSMGTVLEKTLDREDVTLKIAEIEGKLKSKREILGRTRKFLDDSDVPATLEIERTMTGLVMEIEQLQGELRVLRDRAAYVVAEISFEFRDRDKIVYVQSPFEWLNTVDVARFTEEF